MSNDYLWDREGPPDAFALELERRLAPLDEAEAILGELEADSTLDEDAVIVPLASAARTHAEPAREHVGRRSWPWLAVALIVLGIGVALLARVHVARLASSTPAVEVGGSGDAHRRVVIGVSRIEGEAGVSRYHVLAALREKHEALARCTLALALGETVELTLELESGELARTGEADGSLGECVRTALDRPDLAELGIERAELALELRGPRAPEVTP